MREAPQRRIVVTVHAVHTYRDRFSQAPDDPGACRDEIELIVREALAEGRLANHKPPKFRLYREPRVELERGLRFVWREDEAVGFIVARHHASEHVITTLLPAGANL